MHPSLETIITLIFCFLIRRLMLQIALSRSEKILCRGNTKSLKELRIRLTLNQAKRRMLPTGVDQREENSEVWLACLRFRTERRFSSRVRQSSKLFDRPSVAKSIMRMET